MTTQTRRTRLRAVYLTDSERDLVRTAFATLSDTLTGGDGSGGRAAAFAKSYTAKRLTETAALFEDKALREQP